MSTKRKSAIADATAAINQAGALLVFPLDNRKEPASLWSHFYPRSTMKWEWDDSGDNRVADLWHLKTELSTTQKVVYTKWFRGRATYFSKLLFVPLLRTLNLDSPDSGLSTQARQILRILEGESPLSTKEIKRQASLQGREFEPTYERAMKELWSRCLIVAFGEVDDGAFPSLAVGATRVLFEDLWSQAWRLDPSEATKRIEEVLPRQNLFYKHYQKLLIAKAPDPKRKKNSRISHAVRFDEL
jgi:hypothetical protein